MLVGCILQGLASLGNASDLSLLGVDFQVHEPPELIDYLRRLTDRLGRAVA